MANLMPGEWDWMKGNPEDAAQQIDMQRRLRFAQALKEQSQQAPQGQMVGGIYVAPSWTQYASQALKGWHGAKEEQGAIQQMKDSAAARQQQRMEAAQRLAEALKPKQVQDGFEQERTFDQFGSPNGTKDGAPKFKTSQPGADDYFGALTSYYSEIDPSQIGNVAIERLKYGQQQQLREDDMKFRAQQADEARQQRMLELQIRMADSRQTAKERLDAQKELAQMNIDARRDIASIAKAGGGQPYFQAVQTPQGVMSFNARTGAMAPINVNGQSVMGAQYDPTLQGRISNAKASGKEYGEAKAKANIDLPNAVSQAEQTVGLVDDLLKHPGLNTAVGASSKLDPRNYVPGTDAADFKIRLDQLKGQQFMQAYQNLRGGGQITEVEGKKATDAISRMNAASSEKEFINAAKEFQGIVKKGVERSRARAGVPTAQPAPNATSSKGWSIERH